MFEQIGKSASKNGEMRSLNSEDLVKERQRKAILAERLFNFYPPQEMGDNPQYFLAGVIELFEHYPGDIVYQAVSPVNGLPSRYKFVPRISEIKEFLEELMAPIRRQQEREVLAAERARSLPALVDRSRRLSYDELKAKYGENWGIAHQRKKPRWQPPKSSELEALIGHDEWQKIPSRK